MVARVQQPAPSFKGTAVVDGTFKGLCIFPLRLPPSLPVRFLHILPQIFRTESLVQEHPHQLFSNFELNSVITFVPFGIIKLTGYIFRCGIIRNQH